MIQRIKIGALAFLGALLFSESWAEDTTAIYFSKQAGVIAGAAEACGQPISLMIMRVGEVIDVLALNQTDKTYATAAFEKARQEGHRSQEASQQMACPKVINDYNSLPLLQPDYKQVVIAPLMSDKQKSAVAAQPTTPAAAMVPSPSSSVSSTMTPASATPAQPGVAATSKPVQPTPPSAFNNFNTPPPAQQYVPAQTPINTGAAAPINPGANNNAPMNNTNLAQNTEMARLQLAQQLAQMAQTLVSNNNATPPTNVTGINVQTNPQLNTQLYGVGANNPLYTGGLGN